MTKVISIANQKGGVGKTSTTVNLGAGLSRLGADVLLIDLDAQSNLGMALGIENPDDLTFTVTDVLEKCVKEEPENHEPIPQLQHEQHDAHLYAKAGRDACCRISWLAAEVQPECPEGRKRDPDSNLKNFLSHRL